MELEHVEFSVLEGKTLKEIDTSTSYTVGWSPNDGHQIEFITEDGERFLMYHRQDCCESVTIEDICGSLDYMIGTPIITATEASTESREAKNPGVDYWDDGTHTFTFYHLRTKKGDVTIRWHGESNGYYSERVDFAIIKGDQ